MIDTFADIKEHECPKDGCNKSYRSTSQLNDHIKGHDKGFICDICSRPFKSRTGLKTHKLIHMKSNAERNCERHPKTPFSSKASKMYDNEDQNAQKGFVRHDKEANDTDNMSLDVNQSVCSNKYISCEKVAH